MPQMLRNRRFRSRSDGRALSTGWLPPMIDPRDYSVKHPKMAAVVNKLSGNFEKRRRKKFNAPTDNIDLRIWCSPIEDQLQIGSCTAHSAMSIVEYFQIRTFGKHIDGSRLFVYKTTRNLMGVTGDTGAWLRNAMGALATCGVPNERFWQYTDDPVGFDEEPPSFVYAVADNFEALQYFCHDPLYASVKPKDVLSSVRQFLAAGVPSMFGFWGYGSFDYGDQPGHIPMPSAAEMAQGPNWGHAVAAVGYDDKYKITNTLTNQTSKGALLIRNSWGESWGDWGYGWIPYDYVMNSIALDFWSLISMDWVDTDQFFDDP